MLCLLSKRGKRTFSAVDSVAMFSAHAKYLVAVGRHHLGAVTLRFAKLRQGLFPASAKVFITQRFKTQINHKLMRLVPNYCLAIDFKPCCPAYFPCQYVPDSRLHNPEV